MSFIKAYAEEIYGEHWAIYCNSDYELYYDENWIEIESRKFTEEECKSIHQVLAQTVIIDSQKIYCACFYKDTNIIYIPMGSLVSSRYLDMRFLELVSILYVGDCRYVTDRYALMIRVLPEFKYFVPPLKDIITN